MKSQYDLWVESEIAKIHTNFKEKRSELLGQSLLDGFDNPGKKVQAGQLTADYELLDKQEQAAVDEFLRQIQSK